MKAEEIKLSPAEDYANHFPLAAIALDCYLEYRNDYLTDWGFARDKGLSDEFTLALIKEGRRIHKMNDES